MNWIVKAIATLAILAISGRILSACSNQNIQILVNQQMAEYFYNRGLERLGSKDYTRAIADFNEVIRRKSSNSQALAKFGERDVFGAIADFGQSISLNPNLAPIYYEFVKYAASDTA